MIRDLNKGLLARSNPIRVGVDRLAERIPEWLEQSRIRLLTRAEKVLQDARSNVENALKVQVGYQTPFSETWDGLWTGRSKLIDALKAEIEDFFLTSISPAQAREILARAQAGAESTPGPARTVLKKLTIGFSEAIGQGFSEGYNHVRNERPDELIRKDAAKKHVQALEDIGFFEVEIPVRESVMQRFDANLVSTFRDKGWLWKDLTPKDSGGLLGRLIRAELTGDAAVSEAKQFVKSEDNHFRRFWEGALSDLGLPVGEAASIYEHAATRHQEIITAQASPYVVGAVGAVAGPAAAVFVLAAGWHTLPWVVGSLWPLLLVGSIGAVAMTLLSRDSTLKDLICKTSVFFENQIARQHADVERIVGEGYRQFSEQMIATYTARSLLESTGIGSWTDLNAFNKHLDTFSAVSGEGERDRSSREAPPFAAMGSTSLEKGDIWAAAALAVPAFENSVRSWSRDLSLIVPNGSDALLRAVDAIEARLRADQPVAWKLRQLRLRRNRWAHGMSDLAHCSDSQRKDLVAAFFQDLEQVGGHVTKIVRANRAVKNL